VLLIADIQKSKTSQTYILYLCDGSYLMPAFVDPKQEKFDCDKSLAEQIQQQRLRVGQKYHFFGLYLMRRPLPEMPMPQLKTTNHFLANCHDKFLKINANGIAKAENSEVLGEQEIRYFKLQLKNLLQRSKNLACVDVVVVKKFPIYFVEGHVDESGRLKQKAKSRRATEQLRSKVLRQIQDKYRKMLEQGIDEGEAMRQMEEFKRKEHDCFRLLFKVKVVDALACGSSSSLKAERPTFITFMNSTEDMYD